MQIQAPVTLAKLSGKQALQEIVDYLVEGNSKEDLALMVLENYCHEQWMTLLDEVKDSGKESNIYPFTSQVEITP